MRAEPGAFVAVGALLFAASTAGTILWCAPMSAAGGMPMPGGWTMSMAWMRMPGQSWPGAAAMFLGMWLVMMAAMKLPSLLPALWRYRQSAGRGAGACALAGVAYFLVWTLAGLAVFPLGVALAALEMREPGVARLVPVAAGAVVVMAGALQGSAGKARRLAQLRAAPETGSALRHGLRLGVRCVRSCSGLMAILLVVGVMDLRAMALVAAAITAERLAPAGERVARAIGVLAILAGVLLIARA